MLMWTACNILFAVAFTVATAWALGSLLLRKLSPSLYRVEAHLLAAVLGSACLSTVVFVLCTVGLARKGVFLALGLVAIAIAVRFRARGGEKFPKLPLVCKWVFGLAFTILTALYFFSAIIPESNPGDLTRLLTTLDRGHGFQSSAPVHLPEGIDLLFLYAFAFGRHSAATLVDLGLLITLALLVLCYGRRIGHPVAGVAAAILTYASLLIGQKLSVPGIDVATAMVLFSLFYLLQIWDDRRAQALLVPVGILAGFSTIIAVLYALGFVIWKLWRARQPMVRPVLAVAIPAMVFLAPWIMLDWLRGSDLLRQYNWSLMALLILLLALPALRFRPGRELLLASGLFAVIPTSGGIPGVPFVAMVLALGLPNWPWFVALARPRAQMRIAGRWVTVAGTRIKMRTVWRSVAIVIAGACLWFALHLNRSVILRDYFRLEQAWLERWPPKPGKWNVEELAPIAWRLGVLRPARVQVEPGVSFVLDPRDMVAVTILRAGVWQPEIWESLSTSLGEGAVLLDVGAHIGYFSIKAAPAVGRTGHVLAFEPNPETLVLLRDNVNANHAGNVIVEPIACTDSEQMLTLFAGPPSNTGMSSLASENVPVEGTARSYTVRGRRIDDVVRELGLTRVDAIKIDVEGAEAYVLRGAVDTLKRFHPKVVVEVVASQLAAMHSTPDDVTAIFREAGYNHSRGLNTPVTDWEWTVAGR